MRTVLWMITIVLMFAMSSGCNEAQQQWGRGELPAQWQGFFGNSNNSRLDFVQSKVIDRQAAMIYGIDVKDPNGQVVHKAGLIERVRALEAENPAELAERVRKLEEAAEKECLEEATKKGSGFW